MVPTMLFGAGRRLTFHHRRRSAAWCQCQQLFGAKPIDLPAEVLGVAGRARKPQTGRGALGASNRGGLVCRTRISN